MSGGLYRDDIVNVFGGSKKSSRTVRQKEIKGIKLEVHDDHKGGGGGGGGHGEGDGTWIYSFCDLIMNLLMFFVMMFAISNVDKDKMAIIQSALVSYKAEQKKEKPIANTNGMNNGGAIASLSQKEKPDEILKRVKELLNKIDEAKLVEKKEQRDKLAELKAKAMNLEKVVNSEMGAQDRGDAFEVVIAANRLFGSTAAVTPEGRRLLNRLLKELNALNQPLRIAVQSQVGKTAVPGEQQALEVTAQRSTQVLFALRGMGLSSQHRTSVAGVGWGQSGPENVAANIGPSDNVSIYVSLLREVTPPKKGRETTQ